MTKAKSPSKSGKSSNPKKTNVPIVGTNSSIVGWVLLSAVLLLTFLVYWPAFQNGFVWDDVVYIQKNPLIYSLDLQNIFTSYLAGNYHPITVLVHAIEYNFFGFSESGYHIVNVCLHVINTLLVFYLIRSICLNQWIALMTALLFGIHPMHVESVAWVAELKDVLYTLFFLASLLAYLKYINRNQTKWYVAAILLFLVSMLSKGMAVCLPVVLVLIDYYKGRLNKRKVWIEKIPFFILALLFGIIAILAQQGEEALHADAIPLMQRIVFAFYGYITYIQKMIFPMPLSAYYPYPIGSHDAIPPAYFAYIIICAGLFWLTWRSLSQTKKIFFGLSFFTITVFLVLKLLPVGFTIMADRYSYVPSIGIVYLMAEGLYWLYQHKSQQAYKVLSVLLGLALIVFYSYSTIQRSKVWKDGLTLWSDTIEKDDRVHMAFLNRGVYYLDSKNYPAAESDLNRALELDPNYATAYYNRGMVFQQTQRRDAALQDYNKAIELKPTLANAYINRGNLYRDANQFEAALSDYNKASELNPGILETYNNKGILFQNQGNLQAALEEFSKALQRSPTYLSALVNRGNMYSKLNQLDPAMQDYNKAIANYPKVGSAYFARGLLYNKMNESTKACADFREAVNLGYENARKTLEQFCHSSD